MNQIMNLPVVAGVEISTDAEGRYNLNALHRASSEGLEKAPSKWMRNKQAQELRTEIEILTGQICTVKLEGRYGGTFAHELLAISYAGWISPAFQLKVNQTFIDYRSGRLAPAIPQSLPEALRLAAGLAEENEAMKVTVKAYDRIATSEGSMCITDAAKTLSMRPKDLFKWMNENQWIYKRPATTAWIGYQDKIDAGLLEHITVPVPQHNGADLMVKQVVVTANGLSRMAKAICRK